MSLHIISLFKRKFKRSSPPLVLMKQLTTTIKNNNNNNNNNTSKKKQKKRRKGVCVKILQHLDNSEKKEQKEGKMKERTRQKNAIQLCLFCRKIGSSSFRND